MPPTACLRTRAIGAGDRARNEHPQPGCARRDPGSYPSPQSAGPSIWRQDSTATKTTSQLFRLSDEQWVQLGPHLPENQPDTRRVDDRRVLPVIIHLLRIGCRWCNYPAEYGPSITIHATFAPDKISRRFGQNFVLLQMTRTQVVICGKHTRGMPLPRSKQPVNSEGR
ncbi:MAG TPA: hypothetical protein DCK97_03960 [Tistrella mobilis]|uniref:Insertion element IS402-like domain-containing protein n=1 Tax=Tistrella mobilis TaxID=171437 RepID=A0A3B9IFB7_9PROT|nr:hypothetical protein [Tistrella sp.]HAE46554.1 hypothetical protein [Tistrella mobilis]